MGIWDKDHFAYVCREGGGGGEVGFCSIRLTVQEQITIEDFQDSRHAGHHGYHFDEDVENVRDGPWSTGHSKSWPRAKLQVS